MENEEPRFGQVGAARRIARTVFLGSAHPRSRPRSPRADSIARMSLWAAFSRGRRRRSTPTRLTGSIISTPPVTRVQASTRFWFDTRANLRREMEDRKRRFDGKTEVRGKIADAVKRTVGNAAFFDGVYIFTPHSDVPDDSALRLIILPPETWYTKQESRLAFEAVLEIIAKNGTSRPIGATG